MTAATRPAWFAESGAAAPATTVPAIVRAALYVYALSIPFEMPHRAIPLEIPTLMAFVFLGATLLAPSACYRRVGPAVWWFALHLWLVAACAVLAGVEERIALLKYLILLGQLLLLFWAGTNLLADPRVRRGALIALAVACAARALLQVLGIGATEREVWTGGTRVTVLGQNANLSAMILAAGLVALVGWRPAAAAQRALVPLRWLSAAAVGLAIIQSGSRGGLLCAAVGLLALGLHGSSPLHLARNVVVGTLTIAALGWGAWRSDMMRHRFEDAANEGHLAGRERIYPSALEMFVERPLLGWGPIANRMEIARRIDERKRAGRDAHNLLLELLTATGVAGALAFLAGLGLCLRGAWRARRGSDGAVPVAVLAAVLVGTVSGTWIAAKILWFALALAAGAGNDRAPAGTVPCAV
jgi:O-antigen ligase